MGMGGVLKKLVNPTKLIPGGNKLSKLVKKPLKKIPGGKQLTKLTGKVGF